MSMQYWYTHGVYPKLQQSAAGEGGPTPSTLHPLQLVECVQEVGDLIYIPEGWWHATLNTGDGVTLSVAAQRDNAVTTLEANYAHAAAIKQAGKHAEAAAAFERIVHQVPDHAESWCVRMR